MSSTAQQPQFVAFKQYNPSQAACIIFIVIFFTLLVLHVIQATRARIWYMWPLIFATTMEVVGYITREYSIHFRHAKAVNIVSQVLVITAPACLAAELYMLVGRAMIYVGPGYSLIRPGWVTPTFVGFDIVSIGTQAIGGAILFGTDIDITKLKRGRTILILGLFIQLAAFGSFLLFAISFDYKTTRAFGSRVAKLRPMMNAFYISGAFIVLRSVYRAIEFITVDFTKRPVGGYLFSTEWPYYVLDALPIAFAIGVYNLWSPPKYLPKTKQETMIKDDELQMSNGSNGVGHSYP